MDDNIDIEKMLKMRDDYYLRFADGEIQRQFDEFCKERLQHFDWLDIPLELVNDDEEMHQKLYKLHKQYNLFLTYDVERNIAHTSWIRGIETYLLLHLLNVGLNNERIERIMKEFQKYYTMNWNNRLYKFYLSMIFKKLTVNLYIYDDLLIIKSQYERMTQTQEHPVLIWRHFVQVNLNSLITAFFEEDYINTIDKFYFLIEKERDVISELRTKDFKRDRVNIKLKDWEISFIETIGKEEDLEKFKELADKYPHSKIWFQQYDWKKQHIQIETRKNYK